MEIKEFNEKELVSFGNYLLSVKRENRFKLSSTSSDVPYELRFRDVHQEDIDNWKESLKQPHQQLEIHWPNGREVQNTKPE